MLRRPSWTCEKESRAVWHQGLYLRGNSGRSVDWNGSHSDTGTDPRGADPSGTGSRKTRLHWKNNDPRTGNGSETDRAGRGETSLSRFRTGHLPWIGTADRKKSDRRRADRRGDIFRSMCKPRSWFAGEHLPFSADAGRRNLLWFRCLLSDGNCESFWSGVSRCIVRAKPCGEACEHHSGQPGIRTGIWLYKRKSGLYHSGNEKRCDRYILRQWWQRHQWSGGIHHLR